jgi:hypothetical protein
VTVRRDTPVEDLLVSVPNVVRYLIERGLPCLVCGEPAWGSFEELARRSGKSDRDIETMLDEMNVLARREHT